MNRLCQNHRFVFLDKKQKLTIINGKLFLEDLEGNTRDIRSLNPFNSVSNHLIASLTKSVNPIIVLSVLKKKTLSKDWILVES